MVAQVFGNDWCRPTRVSKTPCYSDGLSLYLFVKGRVLFASISRIFRLEPCLLDVCFGSGTIFKKRWIIVREVASRVNFVNICARTTRSFGTLSITVRCRSLTKIGEIFRWKMSITLWLGECKGELCRAGNCGVCSCYKLQWERHVTSI